MYGELLSPAKYASYRTEVCWKQNADLKGEDTLYFIVTNPSKARDTWNFKHFFRMQLWPTRIFARYFNLLAGIGSAGGYEVSSEPASTCSPKSRTLAVSWLSRCRANEAGKHQECNKRNAEYLPTRLLDVKHAQETSRMRLVCPTLNPAPFAENREWATLSHCWGTWGAKENPILTRDNLDERVKPGVLMTDLPKTFQDAVEVAGWMNSKPSIPLYPSINTNEFPSQLALD